MSWLLFTDGADTLISVKYYSPTTNIAIIRVGRDNHKIAWGALTLLSSIDGFDFIPNVIHVSGTTDCPKGPLLYLQAPTGTIKHAQLAAIEHNRAVIARIRARANKPGEAGQPHVDHEKS